MKNRIFTLILSFVNLAAFAQKDYNVIDYGAKFGFSNINTESIQKAIDAAANHGGGRVVIPPGNFVTGPLILKSNVELHLSEDAVLYGSTNRMDYSADKMAVLSSESQHNISISGNGIIDGQGRELVENVLKLLRQGKIEDEQWLAKRPTEKNRTSIIHFKNCQHIKVTNVTLKNAAGWVQNYKECEDLVIDNMKVQSTAYWNNDGIDIVDSKNVRITNSFFNAADDAICLKSENPSRFCDNIYVESCTLRSSASGFKLGTGSVGGFKNITVKNLTVYDTYRSAIALETVDGAFLENVNIQNVNAKNTGNAILLRLGHRNNDDRYSSLKKIYIAHVKAEIPSGKPDIGYPMEGPPPKVPPHNLVPASITGIPGHPVQDIMLEDIEITYGGGSDKKIASIGMDALGKVPENIAGYPEFTMFGELPSWALYVRHAEGVSLNNVKVNYQQADFRPAFVFDDVTGLKLNNINVAQAIELPVIVYKNVTKLTASNFSLPADAANAIQTQP